jgi:Protein of unknown function (DUF3050)
MADVGASTRQFDTFRSLARVGTSVEAAMVRSGVPPHVQAFVAHTMALAQSGSTEEVLAAFFKRREDIILEPRRRRLTTCPWRPSPSILQNLIFGTHSAMGLHQLANPGHKLMVGRVAARKTQEPSSKPDRIVQIGTRFSPSLRMRKIGGRRLRPRIRE